MALEAGPALDLGVWHLQKCTRRNPCEHRTRTTRISIRAYVLPPQSWRQCIEAREELPSGLTACACLQADLKKKPELNYEEMRRMVRLMNRDHIKADNAKRMKPKG